MSSSLGAKNGQLKAVQKGLGKLDREDKPVGGQQFNAVKKSVEALFLQASQRVEALSKNTKGVEPVDVTLARKPCSLWSCAPNYSDDPPGLLDHGQPRI